MLNQYELMYRNIGDLRYVANADDDYKIYELKKEIGQVFIEQHFLANQVVVTIYDYKLDHDVITDFDLSNDYFEIEYCISGEIYIKSQQGISVFKSNELSISMNEAMNGSIIKKKGEGYQGVSMVG